MMYLLHIIIIFSLTLPAVLGLNLVLGRGKILHFGSIGVNLCTAYAIFLTLRWTGNYPLSILVGLVMNLGLSLLIGWLSIRLEGDAFGILSLALHFSIISIVLNTTSITRGALGLPHISRLPGLSSPSSFAFASVITALLIAIFMYRIDRGYIGRSLAALAEHRYHAEGIGIARSRIIIFSFLLAGLASFVTSLMMPQYIGLLHPADYQFHALVFSVLCVVAGGAGSVPGAVGATFLLLVLQELIRFLPIPLSALGPTRLIVFGSILLCTIFIRRASLFPKSRRF